MDKSDKIYIGKSGFHNKGLIASKNIKKGERIFLIQGKKIKFLISSEKQADKAGLNWIGYAKNTWIDPVGYGLFINHSCRPNAAIKGKLQVIALRNIKKGEEVTFDYSMSETDIFWHIKCNCRHKNCRRIIRSIQFLPKNVFKKNLRSIPKYFQSVFKKFHISNFQNGEELKIKWVDFLKKGFRV
ncbi:MAG: SET domain-containing protein [bacterium]|nr:SET domain-containing protein [bacterium]